MRIGPPLKTLTCLAGVLVALVASSSTASAQVVSCAARGEVSANLPPTDSPPLVRCIETVFHPAGSRVAVTDPMVDAQTYAFYIKTPPSLRSQSRWSPYDESSLKNDFVSLIRTGFLEDLWIEVVDEPYENGVMAKHILFHMEERARVKIVDFVSTAPGEKLKVDISKIESTMRDNEVSVQLDSFVDESTLRKVITVIRDLYAEQGYNDANVAVQRTEMPGGPKLLHLTFRIDPGPKVKIAEIVFDGNEAFSDKKLRGAFKHNKTKSGIIGFLMDNTYHQDKFPEDAERLAEYYKVHGYAIAQVGLPQTEVIRTSKDGKERWIRVRVPVEEGRKYQVGKIEIVTTALKADFVRDLFKIKEGDTYSSEKFRKGLEKVKEAYGAYGFWQWVPDADLSPRDRDANGQPVAGAEPIMDVTINMVEGKQFFVNRITFLGNTTTHDAVIRREMRVVEGGIFNAEALKESVRRLNQLGYFKPFEGKEGETDVVQTAGTEDKVDVKLKFQEQNRNQIAFGAGVSQFDGFFGQLSFQTSNFLGRGETVGLSLQRGSQARQYQLSFSEPYLFDRPITVGADVFERAYIFPYQYTQESRGSNWIFGFPLSDYSRGFLNYSYERIRVGDINPVYLDPELLRASPYLSDSLLLSFGGERAVSKISPSFRYNTVNQPIFPSAGKSFTAGVQVAGLGGNTSFVQPSAEVIWYIPFTRRTSLGLHAEGRYIRPYGTTTTLPIFEKLFSGGEFSVRGFDLRSVSPRDQQSGVLVGGNKLLTVNAEYYVNLFGQLRVVAFFDASEVRDTGQRFVWKEPVTRVVTPPTPLLRDQFAVTEPVDRARCHPFGSHRACERHQDLARCGSPLHDARDERAIPADWVLQPQPRGRARQRLDACQALYVPLRGR